MLIVILRRWRKAWEGRRDDDDDDDDDDFHDDLQGIAKPSERMTQESRNDLTFLLYEIPCLASEDKGPYSGLKNVGFLLQTTPRISEP